MCSQDRDEADERRMEHSKPEEQRPKPTWSAPVLEQIEMHSTASGRANHLTERTFRQSRFRS